MLYLADLEEVSILTRKEKSIYLWSSLVTEGLQPQPVPIVVQHMYIGTSLIRTSKISYRTLLLVLAILYIEKCTKQPPEILLNFNQDTSRASGPNHANGVHNREVPLYK